MLVVCKRQFSRFQIGETYQVEPADGLRWIAQDMMMHPGAGYAERWDGFTVAILASGPSLTKADVERVRKWRAQSDQHRVIAVNATYKLAPWADALMALDRDFWQNYQPEFEGARFTQANWNSSSFDCYTITSAGQPIAVHVNSGLAAIDLCGKLGAAKCLLLGFDGQHKNGKAHWHEDHPSGMSNAKAAPKWPTQAAKLASELPASLTVINCTKGSALTAWPYKALQGALNA